VKNGLETLVTVKESKEDEIMTRGNHFYGWILVAILWGIYFINMSFPYYGAGVVNVYMAKAINLDRSTLGLGFTIIALSEGLPGPLIALFLNKMGVRLTIFYGSLTIVFGALLMALVVATGWHYVLVFGIIIGLGVGFSTAIPVQTGVTLWFAKKRALAMSIALTAAGIGGFVAAPLLDRIIAAVEGNWRAGWYFIAGTSVLAAVLSILFVKNRPSDLGQVPDGISEGEESIGSVGAKPPSLSRVYRTTQDWKVGDAIKIRTLWLIIAGTVFFIWPVMMFVAHGVIHLRDLGHSPATAAMSLGLLTLCSVAGRLLAGSLGDRIEPRYIWAVAMLFSMTGILMVVWATSVVQIYLYAIFLGIGYGASYICWVTMVGNYFGPNAFASTMGMQVPITIGTGALSPFLAGLVYDHQGSYTMAFIGTAALSFVGAVVLLLAKPPKLVTGGP